MHCMFFWHALYAKSTMRVHNTNACGLCKLFFFKLLKGLAGGLVGVCHTSPTNLLCSCWLPSLYSDCHFCILTTQSYDCCCTAGTCMLTFWNGYCSSTHMMNSPIVWHGVSLVCFPKSDPRGAPGRGIVFSMTSGQKGGRLSSRSGLQGF